MLYSIKRPLSQRFFQLKFEGFKAPGRNKIKNAFKLISRFAKVLFFYLIKKLKFAFKLTKNSLLFVNKITRNAKGFVVRKLIWSRGRLGRPVANFVVIGIAFIVFLFGEILSGSKFVNSQEISTDYLSNVSDIIPQKNIALTTIPESRKRNEAINYKVESGDSISSIGNKFKISVDALEYVNGLNDNSVLKVGQDLTIPPVAGLIHKVETGDTLNSIAKKYDVPAQSVADFNYILDTSKLAVGSELVIPGAKVPQPIIIPAIPSQFIPSTTVDTGASKGWCMWPTTTRIITQYFSWYHNGVDIATPWNAGLPPLYACAGGVVTRAGWDPWGLGLQVQIDHGNGYSTVYGHMSKIDVGYGQRVGQGEVIGTMGNTGRSTGPHVHFTLKLNGVPQNPLNYIQ